eukprot:797242-Rhodomonas_salina.3
MPNLRMKHVSACRLDDAKNKQGGPCLAENTMSSGHDSVTGPDRPVCGRGRAGDSNRSKFLQGAARLGNVLKE